MAAIGWDAAITALHAGDSLLRRRTPHPPAPASLAAGTPVSLRDTVTGLDDHNTARLLTAIRTQPENFAATANTVNRS